MTVYVRHMLSVDSGLYLPMERFASLEDASRVFKRRAALPDAPVYYDGTRRPCPGDFRAADGSGWLAVWRRRAHQPPPAHGTPPDECWTVKPTGGVAREPWQETPLAPQPHHPDLPHGEHSALVTVWRDGQEVRVRTEYTARCPCGRKAAHRDAGPVVRARVAPVGPEGAAVFAEGAVIEVEPGARVWRVYAAAPDALAADLLAAGVARALARM